MHDTIVNQEIANLDLSKIAALQQKRTLAFVNHFVTTTVQFLNNFARQCEEKLMQFERKLEKINATLVLLEARLSSIPEVNVQTETMKSTEQLKEKNKNTSTEQLKENQEVKIEANIENTTDANTETDTSSVKPEYERFVKMVQVGVPKDAVKLKMVLEGLDPNELDKILP